MKIVLIGYGKMGKTIERLSKEQGHEIIERIDINTSTANRAKAYLEGDVAVEFSHPDAAYENIVEALKAGIPVVSGTTGWLEKYDEVSALTQETDGSFLYASNFSIGVNIMFALNEQLASLMNNYPNYDVSVDETHHVHKKDAPSGTALTLVSGITDHVDRKKKWSLEEGSSDTVKINAYREGEVFGDHKVRYQSPIDTIEVYHTAHTRDGFAMGAILAATWLFNSGKPRSGVKTMKDMMGLRT